MNENIIKIIPIFGLPEFKKNDDLIQTLDVAFNNNEEKFMSIMLVFGQIKLLQIIMKKFGINNKELEQLEDHYFN